MTRRTDSRARRQLWRIVDGGVRDALHAHPEYLTAAGRKWARRSITKRVTGSILGYVEQSTQGRSGARPAPETRGARLHASRRGWRFLSAIRTPFDRVTP